MQIFTINKLQNEKLRIDLLLYKININNPLNLLKKGYSITKIEGKTIRSVNDVKDRTLIETTLPDGKIFSKLIKK